LYRQATKDILAKKRSELNRYAVFVCDRRGGCEGTSKLEKGYRK
jgi:hypothetical protein